MKNDTNFMGVENPGVALVTGASAGIGEEYAKQLASQGFDLILTARRKERLDSLADILGKNHGIKVEVLQADLFESSDVEMISSYIKTLDNLDCLVNNAGFGTDVNFLDGSSDINHFINMLNLHCKVPMQFTHSALPGMIKRDRGHVANISSVASLLFHGYQDPIYDSTKAFLSVFSEVVQLRLEVMKSNVKVKAICPGWTVTEIHDKMKNFDRSPYVWMNSDEVVKIALDSHKNDEIIVITGEVNVNRVIKARKEAREIREILPLLVMQNKSVFNMRILIIVFSQTGGTKKIAEMIKKGIVEKEYECEIVDIKKIDMSSINTYDLIGIGCRTFYYREPVNVKIFIQKLDKSSGQPCFIFCTHGSVMGNTLFYMADGLKKKGFKIIGAFDSYSESSLQFYPKVMHTANHPDEIELGEAYDFGKNISAKITDKNILPSLDFKLIEEGWWVKSSKSLTLDVLRRIFPQFKINPDTCTECKICMDECPVDTIDIFSTPPSIQKEGCIYCFNCEKKCPTGAIEVNWDETIKNNRRNLKSYIGELKKAESEGKFRPYVDYEKII